VIIFKSGLVLEEERCFDRVTYCDKIGLKWLKG
jgi:hypothetical protein